MIKTLLASGLLSFVLFAGGCGTVSRADVEALVSTANERITLIETVVDDLKTELAALPEGDPRRDDIVLKLEEASGVLEDAKVFLVDTKELLDEVDASNTELGFGILEMGLTALGLGGVAGYAGAARRAARKHRDLLKTLEEGFLTADETTIAKLDGDIATALIRKPSNG